MGHLSIDLSPHMHFPLILLYQTPCSCRFERRYDNYHNEAYLAIMLDIAECNRRTSRRPVPWPWSLRFEQNNGTELSWELIMTCYDMFDLIGLHAQMCTQTHPNAWITTRKISNTSQWWLKSALLSRSPESWPADGLTKLNIGSLQRSWIEVVGVVLGEIVATDRVHSLLKWLQYTISDKFLFLERIHTVQNTVCIPWTA